MFSFLYCFLSCFNVQKCSSRKKQEWSRSVSRFLRADFLIKNCPPANAARRGVNWNLTHINLTHLYTESVTATLSATNHPCWVKWDIWCLVLQLYGVFTIWKIGWQASSHEHFLKKNQHSWLPAVDWAIFMAGLGKKSNIL